MPDRSLAWLSASQLTTLYARGELSPVDVVEAMLARAATLQPHLNAFVLIDEAGARSAAKAAQERWQKGAPLSPLDGVPTSIKDTTPVKGWPTRYGSHATDETPAAENAPVSRQAASRGHGPARQDHHAGVRLEGADRLAPAGHHAQPVEPQALARRLVGRRLVAHRRRHQSVQSRQRWRRLDPHPRGAHRPGRTEAVLRPHRAISRRLGLRRRDQPGRAVAHRARHGAGPERAGRPRSARLALAAGRPARLHGRARRRRARAEARPQPRSRPCEGRARRARAGRRRCQTLRRTRRHRRGGRPADRAVAEFLRAVVDRQLRHPLAPDPDTASRQARSRLPRRRREGTGDHPGRLCQGLRSQEQARARHGAVASPLRPAAGAGDADSGAARRDALQLRRLPALDQGRALYPALQPDRPARRLDAGRPHRGRPAGRPPDHQAPPRADQLVLRAMRAYERAAGWTWPQPKVLEALARL